MSTLSNTYGDSPDYLSLYQPGDDEELVQHPRLKRTNLDDGLKRLGKVLNRTAKDVLREICHHTECDGMICWKLTQIDIAGALDISTCTVRRSLRASEGVGLLVTREMGRAEMATFLKDHCDIDHPDRLPTGEHTRNVYFPEWGCGLWGAAWPANDLIPKIPPRLVRPSLLARFQPTNSTKST